MRIVSRYLLKRQARMLAVFCLLVGVLFLPVTAWGEVINDLDPGFSDYDWQDDGSEDNGGTSGQEDIWMINRPVTGVSLNRESVAMDLGQQITLQADVQPEYAANPAVSWNSSDEKVVIVDSTGTITAVGTGNCQVTVTTADGGFQAVCQVKVSGSGSSLAGTEWTKQTDVTAGKQWNITFSQVLDEKTVTSGYFSVKDEKGRLVPTTVLPSSLISVMVVPVSDYQPGNKYFLYIHPGVSSAEGKTLGRWIRMEFTIKK